MAQFRIGVPRIGCAEKMRASRRYNPTIGCREVSNETDAIFAAVEVMEEESRNRGDDDFDFWFEPDYDGEVFAVKASTAFEIWHDGELVGWEVDV